VSRFPSRNVCSSGGSCIGNVAASASRVHIPGFTQSLRVMPAMEAGVSDYVWTLDELIALLD